MFEKAVNKLLLVSMYSAATNSPQRRKPKNKAKQTKQVTKNRFC